MCVRVCVCAWVGACACVCVCVRACACVCNKTRVIRTATKRTETSPCPPMQCTYIPSSLCCITAQSGLGITCIALEVTDLFLSFLWQS